MNIIELTEITGSIIQLTFYGGTREWHIQTDLLILDGDKPSSVSCGLGKTPQKAAEALAKHLRNQRVMTGGHDFNRQIVVPTTLIGFDHSFNRFLPNSNENDTEW